MRFAMDGFLGDVQWGREVCDVVLLVLLMLACMYACTGSSDPRPSFLSQDNKSQVGPAAKQNRDSQQDKRATHLPVLPHR